MPSRSSRRFAGISPALTLFVVLLVVLALTGGSSRYDQGALFLLRPAVVLIAAVLLLQPAGGLVRTGRVPALFLALLAAIIVAQLVPLPPAIWALLPERAGYLKIAQWLGQPQPWRPLSLVPVLTWNSLLTLLPVGAMIAAASRLDTTDTRFVVNSLIVLGVVSALLGVVQVGGIGYLYGKVSAGLPDGLFANRNHQAAFLAGLLPMLALWASFPGRNLPAGSQAALAGLAGILFIIIILMSGSRTGLLLAGLDLIGGIWLYLRGPVASERRGAVLIAVTSLAAAIATLVGVAFVAGQTGGFARFAALDTTTELRIQAFPTVKSLAMTYLPWGSGFGTFDPLFRMHEPDTILSQSYFNNAHNDIMELAITGGFPALFLMAGLLFWLVREILDATRRAAGRQPSHEALLPLAAAMMITTWLLASLSDYPLRTSLAGALFALACCLLQVGTRVHDGSRL